MNKKHILASLGALAVLLSGCQHNLEHNMVPDKLGFSYSENLQQPSVLNNSMDVSVIKSGKGTSSATVRIERLSQEELTAWCESEENKEYGYDFLLASESRYELSTEELSFAASDTRQLFKVSWTPDFFANSAMNGKNYVIALRLSDPSIDADPNRSTVIIQPRLTHVTFKARDLKSVYPTLKDAESINSYEGEINLDYAIPSQDIKVTIVPDNSLIEKEAESRGKAYEVAPEGLFSLDKNEVTVEAGKTVAHFGYKIDLTVLFNEKGEFIKQDVNYMIPLVFSKKDPELLGEGEYGQTFVIVSVADDKTVERPDGPTTILHGPWEVLEGADLHIGADPLCESPSWYGNYNTTKLVDWGFGFTDDATKNGYWGSYFWSPVEFPMVFVFDTGSTYTFDRFYKVDSRLYQGQFQDFEVYVAREYAGADTDWTLAAKGNTGTKGWQNYPTGTNEDKIDEILTNFSYVIPADETAEGSEVNLTRGRYIKLCITKSSRVDNKDCGYIMEFYATGWEN